MKVTQWIGVKDFEYSSGICLGGKLKEVTRIGLFVLAVAVVVVPMLIVIAKAG